MGGDGLFGIAFHAPKPGFEVDAVAGDVGVEVQHGVAGEGAEGDGGFVPPVVHGQLVAAGGVEQVPGGVFGGNHGAVGGVGQGADQHRLVGIAVEAADQHFVVVVQGQVPAEGHAVAGTGVGLQAPGGSGGFGMGGLVAVGVLAVAVAAAPVEFGDGVAAFDPGGEDLGQFGRQGRSSPAEEAPKRQLMAGDFIFKRSSCHQPSTLSYSILKERMSQQCQPSGLIFMNSVASYQIPCYSGLPPNPCFFSLVSFSRSCSTM